MELLARRDQLVELKYKDRVFPNPTKDTDPCSDNHLHLGTSETRGSLMVCPALEKYAWEQLHLESLAAKKRREAAGGIKGTCPKWWASSGTCSQVVEMACNVEASRDTPRRRKVFS